MRSTDIWSEEFGAATDTPILLIMGSMSQGVLWPDEFVGRLTAGGRRVIRYDHRDTGMSGTADFATEPYTWNDIKNDVYRVMDTHGLDSAHLVGHSAGGLLGQLIAVEQPKRVRSLTAIASSPLGGGEGQVLMRALTGQPQPEGSLPEPTPEFVAFYRALMAAPPPESRRARIDGMIAEQRVLHGTGLPFDEDAARRLQERVYDRARDLSAVANHRLAAMADPDFEPVGVLDQVKAPTLVIEGSHEPAKPGHGAVIAEQIPGARLMIVAGMGHTLPLETHRELADAILTHTAE
ncbi:Pimeloyl-ACP methyl ester carboxylesterase [Marinactinospora thermotolerans DSM 45154]|uniref:Pimeloyl-ACP methyl ester carboxylesterase n=1 Tax=Marinactinospora thermotolerans DSM 45154 TaxID=1122192 RepID=A0A1T4R7Y8_9ACTN|nr:alpha/beta fold hydrolase [Marinactinospora thermotolerans]SKA12049.1 Pimeloyl-ACP methyl ester carboxylesterase [Marinactinospora thermotolerans DSM 45154]